MWDNKKHMEGFEKEDTLSEMFNNPDVRQRLKKWSDFKAVARVINPELCEKAFEFRPCERTLRYIGYDTWDEADRPTEPIEPYVYGNIYHATDFNGAMYTIKETGRTIGCVYFEVIS